MIVSNRPLLVVQRVAEAQPLGPGHVLADQLPQVPLPGHEAHDRHGPVHRLGLHQVRQLGRLAVDEPQVGRVHGQPEDQLVEEQDQGVVAQAGRVLADDRQALVEPHEVPAAVADDLGVRGGDGLQQGAHQAQVGLRIRRRRGGCLERRRVPGRLQLAPAAVRRPGRR